MLAAIMIFALAPTRAQQQFDPDGPVLAAPELVLPLVTKNTKIHISGSFTADKAVQDPLTIVVCARLRLMEPDGKLVINNLTITGDSIAVDPSDPSGRRLAFSSFIDLNGLVGDGVNFRSGSLFLDAIYSTQKGARQSPNSLGWFTGTAVADINGDGLVIIAVQLSQPQRDSNLQITQF
jgi:hypothetical protein